LSEIKPIFLVDAMLGNIAKKLRLLGFDSLYFSDIKDEDVIRIAKKENRIVLTNDEQLVRISKKQNVKSIHVTKKDEINQILQIGKQVNLGRYNIDSEKVRCSLCNNELHSVQKSSIVDKIPKGVFDNNENFWECKNCKKIYWEGTHVKNLQKFVEKLNEFH